MDRLVKHIDMVEQKYNEFYTWTILHKDLDHGLLKWTSFHMIVSVCFGIWLLISSIDLKHLEHSTAIHSWVSALWFTYLYFFMCIYRLKTIEIIPLEIFLKHIILHARDSLLNDDETTGKSVINITENLSDIFKWQYQQMFDLHNSRIKVALIMNMVVFYVIFSFIMYDSISVIAGNKIYYFNIDF